MRRPEITAGRQLRAMRLRLSLSMRDVEEASRAIASRKHDHRFLLQPGRISQIENGLLTPSIFGVYTFSLVYSVSIAEIFSMYGLVSLG